MQTSVLYTLFQLIEQNLIDVPIYDAQTVQGNPSNREYLQTVMGTSLQKAFPHIQA